MSYYRPSYSHTASMTRGRGFSSSRGPRGGSWNNRGYGSRGNNSNARFSSASSFSHSYDSRPKYPPNERYSGSNRGHDDYRRSYHHDSSGYAGTSRDSSSHRSPDRKRMRTEAINVRHESSAGYGDSYGQSRYESTSFPPRRSFSSDHRPPPFTRRDEFRKPAGPPGSPRGGFRGRIRGSRGGRIRERPIRKRLLESSYAVRRRTVAARSAADYVRRVKVAKLRSAAFRRALRKKSGTKDSDEEEKDNEEIEETEEVAKDEAEIVKSEVNVAESPEKKSPKKEKESVSEIGDKKSESDDNEQPYDEERERNRRNRFIKLICIHCNTKCVTFSKYSMHLLTAKHTSAMRRVAMKQKQILSQMRQAQRNAQRELEKTTDDLAPRTNFCPLCKLNYKQPKLTHQGSESHKNMKKFLMPYCKICAITFKSPMLFENHLCSIEHIKRKSRLDMLNGEKSDKEESPDEDNLENFMTIDSVGDVDEEEVATKKVEREQINVGIEQVRKVEVYYCDLCRMYLPRVEDSELQKVLAKHCKQRTHLQNYVRYKEDKDLAKHAERLQRKENAEKEKEKDEKSQVEDPDTKKEKSEDDKDKTALVDEEDKMWADVDKDLGDILAEENKSSDEDDDSHVTGERYDRFKYSEKNEEEPKEGAHVDGEEEQKVKEEMVEDGADKKEVEK